MNILSSFWDGALGDEATNRCIVSVPYLQLGPTSTAAFLQNLMLRLFDFRTLSDYTNSELLELEKTVTHKLETFRSLERHCVVQDGTCRSANTIDDHLLGPHPLDDS